MAQFEAYEVPDEFLEAVSGGALTPESREDIIYKANAAKRHGLSEAVAIMVITSFSGPDYEEKCDLIREVYAS